MVYCAICSRIVEKKEHLEKHHLIPKSMSGKETIYVCIDCGNQIHELFNNKQLRDVFNSIEKLRSNERIKKWVSWIRKKAHFGICMKKKKKRK